ncbi:dolichol kinase [Stetteria hydrogenophila]
MGGVLRASEAFYAVLLSVYVFFVVYYLTRWIYEWLRARMPEVKAVYYNRKIIHALAGGVVALLVPYVFSSPTLPLVLALLLAVFTYIPHRTGRLLYWFQVPDNMYEVRFCIMWGLAVYLAWRFLGDPWLGVVPVLFMAFGDAATGVVRNLLYGRRTKAWVGNLAMLAVTLPIGYALAGIPGALAAVAASVVEHFEFKYIDDNVTVPLVALAVLAAARLLY